MNKATQAVAEEYPRQDDYLPTNATEVTVSSTANALAGLAVGFLTAMTESYEERKALEKAEKHRLAVGLIQGAIASKRRISLADLAVYVSGTTYLSRKELAEKLDISIETFNAGVKRWYHIF